MGWLSKTGIGKELSHDAYERAIHELPEGLPPDLHDLSLRIISGTEKFRADIRDRAKAVRFEEKKKDRLDYDQALRTRYKSPLLRSLRHPSSMLTPSLGYRLLDVRMTTSLVAAEFRRAAREIAATIRGSMREFHHLEDQPADFRTGQNPKYAIVICADSRMPDLLKSGIGVSLGFRNVGGSIEAAYNPSQLSQDAEETLNFGDDKDIKTLVIFTHGLCGCIQHALKTCAHARALPPHASEKERINHRMGLRKKHVYDAVAAKTPQPYLDMLKPAQNVNGEAFLLAMELEHGLHSKKLAENFYKRITPKGRTPIKVVLVHMDFRTGIPFIHDDTKNTFVALIKEPLAPLGLPKSASTIECTAA